ncbi:hypothetical protein QM565_32555 [Geitlerinema splendidum]|nr:hypothetical protein [Geitlerinema splendidum]
MIIVAFAYGIMTFLFEKTPLPKQEEEVKVTSTSIETATKKVNLEEAFRNSIENKLKALSDKITAVETLFQEGVKRGELPSQSLNTEEESQDPSLNSSFPKSSLVQELETKILQLEHQLDMQKNTTAPSQTLSPQSFPYQAGQEEEKGRAPPYSKGLIRTYGKS